MSLVREALKGAQAEVNAAPGTWAKIKVIRNAFGHIAAELAGIATLAPYAARTSLLYHSLPDASRRGFPKVMQAAQLPATSTIAAPSSTSHLGVHIKRHIPYGDLTRNRLDVYIPDGAGLTKEDKPDSASQIISRHAASFSEAAAADQAASSARLARDSHSGQRVERPVVFFVHGGVWASGEKWHYAPMAVRLAQEGCVVVVISYSMFPDALCPAMVDEVSQALSWTFDNAAAYGGDPARIAALGHSAGSHLVASALLQRARADSSSSSSSSSRLSSTNSAQLSYNSSHQLSSQQNSSHGPETSPRSAQSADLDWHPNGGETSSQGGDNRVDWGQGTGASASGIGSGSAAQSHNGTTQRTAMHGDGRLPWVFIGMAGVYDINKHFEFERMRGVEGISMMKRAMGGFSGFDAMSPSVQLSQAWSNSITPLSVPGPGSPSETVHQSNNIISNTGTNGQDVAPQYFTSFPLLGAAIPARFSHTSPSTTPLNSTPTAAAHSHASLSAGSHESAAVASIGNGLPHTSPTAALKLSQVQRLCPVVLMSSAADHMVPWHESAELIHHLSMCGVPCRHLMYNHVRHSDYVLAWTLLKGPHQRNTQVVNNDSSSLSASGGGSGEGEAMSPFAVDLLRLLFSEGGDHVQELECSRRQQQAAAPQGAGWAPAVSGWPVARL